MSRPGSVVAPCALGQPDQSPIAASRSLLVVGASVRAAVHSALRAGLAPTAVDLFADRDLVARVVPLRRWPGDLPQAARGAPPGPWMYTGALENHPRIVARIAAERPLWGNPAAVLRRVRDPFRVHAVLSGAGLRALPVRPPQDPPPPDGTWLCKPRRGAAGRRIVRWTAETASAGTPLRERYYFQQHVDGVAVSAVYVASAANVTLLGLSQQLTGMASLGAKAYAYCGSIGPLRLSGETAAQIERIGIEIGRSFALMGLFGVDFVLAGGTAWPVEVNPRYTASVEVLEHGLGVSLLDRHRRACEGSDNALDGSPRATSQAAKAILYAPHDLRVPPLAELESTDPIAALPAYADLPHDGSVIRKGRPICTVLASGAHRTGCLELLDARLARVRRILGLATGRDLADDLPQPEAADCLHGPISMV